MSNNLNYEHYSKIRSESFMAVGQLKCVINAINKGKLNLVFFEGGQILASFRKLALFHSLANVPEITFNNQKSS